MNIAKEIKKTNLKTIKMKKSKDIVKHNLSCKGCIYKQFGAVKCRNCKDFDNFEIKQKGKAIKSEGKKQ